MNITKTTQLEPKIVRPVFTFDSFAWPFMTLLALVCLIIVDGRITLETESGFRFAFGSGPISGLYLLAFLIFVVSMIVRRQRHLKVWQQAIKAKQQYLSFDETGIRYGYQGVQDIFLAWEAVSKADLTKRNLKLELAGRVMSVNLEDFSPDERTALRNFLDSRKLLKNRLTIA